MPREENDQEEEKVEVKSLTADMLENATDAVVYEIVEVESTEGDRLTDEEDRVLKELINGLQKFATGVAYDRWVRRNG